MIYIGLVVAAILIILFLIWRLKLHIPPDPNIPGRSFQADIQSEIHLQFHRHAYVHTGICVTCKENPATLETLQQLRSEEKGREAAYREHAKRGKQ